MTDEREYRLVPIEPEPETVTRIGWTLTIVLFIVGVVSLLGEILGWWNDLGEIGTTVGVLGSTLIGYATLKYGADRSQVSAVHEAVEGNGKTLKSLDRKADKQIEKLDKLDDLDRIQLELDQQTGVLEDIRDLLS